MAQGWKGVELRDPSELGYEARRPYKFSCTHPHCFWYVSCKDEADAVNQQNTHPCPWWGGETKVSWSVGKTLVEQMWEKLDDEYAVLVTCDFKDAERKARARAIAECIALFMPPHFVTADDVIREAKRRNENTEEYQTPGLGARRYELPEPREFAAKPRKAAAAKPPAPPKKSLDPQVERAIKFALQSSMFTPEELAKTYGLTVADVLSVK